MSLAFRKDKIAGQTCKGITMKYNDLREDLIERALSGKCQTDTGLVSLSSLKELMSTNDRLAAGLIDPHPYCRDAGMKFHAQLSCLIDLLDSKQVLTEQVVREALFN